jgi:uncharacterized protein (TIGR00730 family)
MKILRCISFVGLSSCMFAMAQGQEIKTENTEYHLQEYVEPLKNPKDIGFSDLTNVMGNWGMETLRVVGGANTLDKIERPLVTIFGGTSVAKDSKYYTMTYDIAEKLTKQGCAIITGGGLGIMEAANCGARAHKTKATTSIAIGIEGLGVQNSCTQARIMLDHFYPRKWLLMEYASAFVVMPGGVGTMDELFGIVNLMTTGKMPIVPIYVVGKKFWKHLKLWLDGAVKDGLLTQKAYDLMIFTEDKDQICDGILNFIKEHQPEEEFVPAEIADSLEPEGVEFPI